MIQHSNSNYRSRHIFCNETRTYELPDFMTKIGLDLRKLRIGKRNIYYASNFIDGFTVIKLFRFTGKDKNLKRHFTGTRLIRKKLTQNEIFSLLFDETLSPKADKRARRHDFKAIVRYRTLSINEWEKLYTPNSYLKRSTAINKKDNSLFSISALMHDQNIKEVFAGGPATCIMRARREVQKCREKLKEFPCYEAYAIWINFDPHMGLLKSSDYDDEEPLLYQHHYLDSKKNSELLEDI